jgi:hypothetical protein
MDYTKALVEVKDGKILKTFDAIDGIYLFSPDPLVPWKKLYSKVSLIVGSRILLQEPSMDNLGTKFVRLYGPNRLKSDHVLPFPKITETSFKMHMDLMKNRSRRTDTRFLFPIFRSFFKKTDHLPMFVCSIFENMELQFENMHLWSEYKVKVILDVRMYENSKRNSLIQNPMEHFVLLENCDTHPAFLRFRKSKHDPSRIPSRFCYRYDFPEEDVVYWSIVKLSVLCKDVSTFEKYLREFPFKDRSWAYTCGELVNYVIFPQQRFNDAQKIWSVCTLVYANMDTKFCHPRIDNLQKAVAF